MVVKLHSDVTKKRGRLTDCLYCVSSLIHAVGGVSAIKSINEGITSDKRSNWPIRSCCLMTSTVSRLLCSTTAALRSTCVPGSSDPITVSADNLTNWYFVRYTVIVLLILSS